MDLRFRTIGHVKLVEEGNLTPFEVSRLPTKFDGDIMALIADIDRGYIYFMEKRGLPIDVISPSRLE